MGATAKIHVLLCGFIFVVISSHLSLVRAQSDCSTVLSMLSPCLNYIQGNSSNPSSSCCNELPNVIRSRPLCLCQVVNGGSAASGIAVNQTLAKQLPTACGLHNIPDISACKAVSPSGAPNASPSGAGFSKELPHPLIFLLLVVASFSASILANI